MRRTEWQKPTKVTVTGAAGQIGYAMLFRIASGQMLGPDTAVHLQAARDPGRGEGRRGHRDRADDCAFPLLAGIDIYDDAKQAFDGATSRCWSARARARRAWSAPTCSRPTAAIFKPQGEAIDAGAADDIKVLVVGNPANTNALIAQCNADGRARASASPR